METDANYHSHPLEEAAALGRDCHIVLVFDADQVFFEALARHVRSVEIMTRVVLGLTTPLPTYEEVYRAGGTFDIYKKITDFDYDKLNQRMVHSLVFNRNLPPVAGNISEVIQELNSHGFKPIMCLTSRPDSIAELTREEIKKTGQIDIPVLARPADVNTKDATSWKLRELTALAKKLPQATIVMIDDSIKLARAIREFNHPQIKALLFQGPIAKPTVGEKAVTWDTMLAGLQTII